MALPIECRSQSKGGGVELISLAKFSDGCPVFIHQKAEGDRFQRQQIAKRALDLIGTQYDLINFNCEHLANFAQKGKAESPQLRGATLLALFAIGGIAALVSSKKG